MASPIAPIAIDGTEAFNTLFNSIHDALTASQDAEIVIDNQTASIINCYGYKPCHGGFVQAPPLEIPAYASSSGGTGEAAVFSTKSTGNGTAGVAIFTFGDTNASTMVNVVILVWQNPCWTQSGRGVLLETAQVPADQWPPADPKTKQPYTPTEFCEAVWNVKTTDPANGGSVPGKWELQTNPQTLGGVTMIARWSGTGKDGVCQLQISDDETAALKALDAFKLPQPHHA